MFSPEEMDMLIDLFRTEMDELTKECGKVLLALEDKADNAERATAATAAFRYAHTIKGAACTLGYDRIAEIANQLEDVFSALEKNELQWTPAVVDTLIGALDAIGDLAATSRPDDPVGAVETSLVRRMRSLLIRPEGCRSPRES